MTETNEPRALTAALANPNFATRTGGGAVHVANRHVERWAPEAGANRVRSLRSLGFVDRLVSPWIDAAQRSASLRLFSHYHQNGMSERNTTQTSWLFPRPWYQDELDWMAAARATAARTAMERSDGGYSPAPVLTTRGTYVTPAQAQSSQLALPSALYEYIAPSLSVAPPTRGDVTSNDAYSPLVPFQAAQAAQVMARAIAPLVARSDRRDDTTTTMLSPGLRAVMATMLERSVTASTMSNVMPSSRLAEQAPELVTPPAPRPDAPPTREATSSTTFGGVVDDMVSQRAQIAELQRAARHVAEQERSQATQQAAAQQAAAQQATAAQQAAAPRVSTATPPSPTGGDQAERQRVEARIAQRVAERREVERALERATADRGVAVERTQRLHDQARDAAARDARAVLPTPSEQLDARVDTAPEQRRMPDAIVAAIANLSPELANMVAANIAQRPDRAVQTIAELGEALRAVELMARTAASGGSFESSRGPRLVMPAGLGGLVATVDRNVRASEAQGAGTLPPLVARAAFEQAQAQGPQALAQQASQAQQARQVAQAQLRVPAMPWLAAPSGAPMSRPLAAATTALGATEATTPAALQHVAWADRWLARFSGARTTSLDLLTASSAGAPEARFAALSAAAPDSVFVAPQFDGATERLPIEQRATPVTPTQAPVRRYDDHEETPDDVFASIAASATRTRVPEPIVAAPVERESLADVVAHSVPSAPGAGLAAQLGSSPFAPAFRHVFPLSAASTFDVRALFGDGLSVAYLAGLYGSATREVATGAAMHAEPAWLAASLAPVIGDAGSSPLGRDALDWEPAYVAPVAPEAGPSVRGGELGGVAEVATAEPAVAPALTTMRSALLSWDVEQSFAPGTTQPLTSVSSIAATHGGTQTHAATHARSMIESMTMPMFGERAALHQPAGSIEIGGEHHHVPTYAAPGMIADRAHAWSVAQERSSADLAFDFVTPELVLAARVYGLGPAEAAQAARLAIAGPGQLATMASTVDRTFVQALAIEAERRAYATTASSTLTAYPRTAPDQLASPGAFEPARTGAGDAWSPAPSPKSFEPMPGVPFRSAFGIDRRAPRGAFMWPAATIAALGLTAAAPDGDHSMSVAALELLAAQSVAELGTYVALGLDRPQPVGVETAAAESRMTSAATPAAASPTRVAESSGVALGAEAEPAERDVLTTAGALVPAARRAKFEAMYVALGQSQAARTWSPAARAARALALAGRGDESITAYERAQAAWDVLPVVAPADLRGDSTYAGFDASFDLPGATRSTGTAAQRAAQQRGGAAAARQVDGLEYVESRPGLAALSARAGEALTSYVNPTMAATPAPARERDQGAVMRVPTAAQEMVRTGRPSGRYGGGEVEIPTWFESAARKMLDERSAGVSDGISLAELTLVNAAPSTQIAASTRGVPSAAPASTPHSSQGPASQVNAAQVDVEKVANEVYKQILVLMDSARSRNGEPYL